MRLESSCFPLVLFLASLIHMSANISRLSNPSFSFYLGAFDQLAYIFSDNSDAVVALNNFKTKFTKNQQMLITPNNNKTATALDNDLQIDSNAGITKNTADASSSDTITTTRSMIISGSKGQFVKSQTGSEQDSMRVYNIGEIMIPGVVAFVEVQANIARDGTYYLDAKVNEHNDGMVRQINGVYVDSKTISRKVLIFDSKLAFGMAEVYVISIGNQSVDFKLYTIASASNITVNRILSSVIIEIAHIVLSMDSSMIVEQASLTSTSTCDFEQMCKVVNLGSIKVNGDLMSKLVQAKSVAGADFQKQQAGIAQMYSLDQTTAST